MPASHRNGPDGQFDLYYQGGWAHLAVRPPAEGGKPVYPDDVQNRMKVLGVPRPDGAEMDRIIEEADGEPHRLVEWPEGARLASVITVTVHEDRLSASVTVSAPRRGAAAPTVQEVVNELEAAGVCYGVDHDAIGDLLRDEAWDELRVVAAGVPAVHARSASIRYHFNPDRGKPYMKMDHGRVNLKELNFIENRSADDLLAELTPPVKPANGHAVTGEILPAATHVEPVELVAGENAELTDGGTAVRATADGNVRLAGDAVVIEPMIVLENVDYQTGNISFQGSVLVEKSIADGFMVEAGGDVQVGRAVGRATIVAGGNVLLTAGINGAGEGRVECGGNLAAGYIEQASVTCRGFVFVEEAVMHSDLSVWRHLVLTGRRAEIIGGQLIAGGSVWCRKLGSVAEPATQVNLGIPPAVISAHARARHELEQCEERIEKARQELAQVDRLMAQGRDDPRLPQARRQLTARIAGLTTEAEEAREAVEELRGQLQAAEDAVLVVEDTIFKGVSVSFGKGEYRPPAHGARATILSGRHGRIRESGYNPASPPVLSFHQSVVPRLLMEDGNL